MGRSWNTGLQSVVFADTHKRSQHMLNTDINTRSPLTLRINQRLPTTVMKWAEGILQEPKRPEKTASNKCLSFLLAVTVLYIMTSPRHPLERSPRRLG